MGIIASYTEISLVVNLFGALVGAGLFVLVIIFLIKGITSFNIAIRDKQSKTEPKNLLGNIQYNLNNVWQPTSIGGAPPHYWLEQAYHYLYALGGKYPDSPEYQQATNEYNSIKKQVEVADKQNKQKAEQKNKLAKYFKTLDKKKRKKINTERRKRAKEWFVGNVKKYWPLYISIIVLSPFVIMIFL